MKPLDAIQPRRLPAGRQTGRPRCRRALGFKRPMLLGWLVLGTLLHVPPPQSHGDVIPVSESQLKAAWLLNFAKLTEWPPEAFASTNHPIVVEVMGDEGFEEQLERSLKDKKAHGREFSIRRIAKAQNTRGSHIVYLGEIPPSAKEDVLRKLKDAPVLTIDGTEERDDSGCVVTFLRIDKKIRFNVDLRAANTARLKLNPNLLGVAHSVKGKLGEKKEDTP